MSLIKPPPLSLRSRAAWLKSLALVCLVGLIVLPRTLPYPAQFLTYDETKIEAWVGEIGRALLAGDWAGAAIANNPYPALTLAWLTAIQAQTLPLLPGWGGQTKAQMLSSAEADVLAALPRQRLVLALVNSLAALTICWLLQRLYDNFVAVTASLLIALDPFLLTESRPFRTEGLTTSLMMLSALTVIYYTRQRRRRWLILSGCLASLAILTRVSALYLFCFAGLVLLGWPWLSGQRRYLRLLQYAVGDVLLWSITAVFLFVALWPALWTSPLEGPGKIYQALEPVFTKTSRVYPKGVFFQGHTMGDVDPGPAFYLWAGAYRTTPVLWLGLAAALAGGLGGRLRWKKKSAAPGGDPAGPPGKIPLASCRSAAPALTSLFILAYVGFYFISINLSATKIDRYLVAMLPGLSILAAWGFALWLDYLPRPALASWAVWGGVLIASAIFSLPHHPYYYTYWNPLLGGGPAAVQKLPASGRQGIDVMLDALNKLPHASELKLTGAGLHLDLKLECPVIFAGRCLEPSSFLASDYVLLSLFEVQHEAPLSNLPLMLPDAEIAYKYSKAGVDYAWLYKMPDNLQYVGHWLDLSAGAFSGYQLPATEVAAGGRLEINLFWQNGEQSGWRFDDSELFVKVLDEAGQTQQVASAQLKPEFGPYLSQPRAILVFTAPLYFPPATPLGLYTLEIGLRLKATGTETLNFPLTNVVKTITVNRGVVAASLETWPMQRRLERPMGQTGLTLLGYDQPLSKIEEGGPRFYLYWRAEKPLTENYNLKLALLNRSGQSVAAWSRPLAPEFHPLTAWQPGEIVTLPFPLELGYALPPDTTRVVLSLLPAGRGPAEPLATANLSPWPKNLALLRPEVKMQHSLAGVTFGRQLDLLGYDLIGQSNAAGGRLFVTLYWLNRQPLQPVEVQVQVLAENGAVISAQLLPVSAPTALLTWQSASRYDLFLDALPSSLIIKARPAGAREWYSVQSPALPAAGALTIDHILSKTIIISP